jgi:hypothetical protein
MNYITLGILIVLLLVIVYLSYEKKKNKQENFNNIQLKPILNKTHDFAKYLILEN